MSKYLTPEEVDELVADCAAPDVAGNRISATLREYAAIVEAVAVAQPYGEREGGLCSCRFCGYVFTHTQWRDISVSSEKRLVLFHHPDCPYLRAREVRGYE